MRGKSTDPTKAARVRELWAQGAKVAAIEAETGVKRDTITRIAKAAGLPGRKIGRPRKERA